MRAGRKRKARRTNGSSDRPSRAGQRRESIHSRKRQWELVQRKCLDPFWGTEVGMLFRDDEVTDAQREAAERFTKLVREYARVAKSPKGLVAAGLELGLGGQDPDPDSPSGQAANQREAVVMRNMRDVYSVLRRGAGDRGIRAVIRMCYLNEIIPFFDRGPLLRGLDVLAVHWGLTKSTVRVHCGA